MSENEFEVIMKRLIRNIRIRNRSSLQIWEAMVNAACLCVATTNIDAMPSVAPLSANDHLPIDGVGAPKIMSDYFGYPSEASEELDSTPNGRQT